MGVIITSQLRLQKPVLIVSLRIGTDDAADQIIAKAKLLGWFVTTPTWLLDCISEAAVSFPSEAILCSEPMSSRGHGVKTAYKDDTDFPMHGEAAGMPQRKRSRWRRGSLRIA